MDYSDGEIPGAHADAGEGRGKPFDLTQPLAPRLHAANQAMFDDLARAAVRGAATPGTARSAVTSLIRT